MAELLAGRRGVVVGISGENSIGWHTARYLQSVGADVGVTFRPARREIAALAESAGLAHASLDVTDERSVPAAFDELGARLGGLDFVVHTLVHVPPGVLARPLLDVSRDDFHTVLEIGARSLLTVTRAALPFLERSKSGRIVTVSSACGNRMTPSYHVAGIAKAALESTVLYLAQELGPKRILVNAVSPSLLPTDGAIGAVGPRAVDAMMATLARRAPTREAAAFDDVSRAIAFFCSDFASNVTGTVLPVDGGFSRLYC